MRRNTRVGYVPQQAEFPVGQDGNRSHRARPSRANAWTMRNAPRASILTLGRAGFTNGGVRTDSLSGGWQRRLAIARELAINPEVLFLDEPTNHLDIEGILWLEKLLTNAPFASVVVSHDRYFLDNVVSGMAEIDRVYPEGIFRVPGSYSQFLEKKADFLLAQSSRQESLANIVRREVEWLRRGAKARTGKSSARTDEAGRLIDELSDLERRTAKAVARIDFTATERRTKRLVSVEGIAQIAGRPRAVPRSELHAFAGHAPGAAGSATEPVRPRCCASSPAKRSPIPAASSSPKPCASSISTRRASSSTPRKLCARDWAAHGDHVIFRGRPIHVAGWAKRFLFDAGQLDRPISSLSGGEQARVLIARLMLQPADFLLLDEPTNDLDIPTLEVLEESLTEFPGALVLVTHDRFMLDRVSTRYPGPRRAGRLADLRRLLAVGAGADCAEAAEERKIGGCSSNPNRRVRRSCRIWKRANGSGWKRGFWKRNRCWSDPRGNAGSGSSFEWCEVT